jgi:Rrf2 family protein
VSWRLCGNILLFTCVIHASSLFLYPTYLVVFKNEKIMLKIPKKVEYAFLALKYISENSDQNCLNTKVISENAEIPYDLTAKILQRLVKQNIISSQQGAKGGYVLNYSTDQLNLARIIAAVDEEVILTNCMFDGATVKDCERIDSCCMRSPLNKVQNKINELFEKTYLTEIIG